MTGNIIPPGFEGKGRKSGRKRTTHCPAGHPRTPENTTGNRTCRICKAEYSHRRYVQRKGSAVRTGDTRTAAIRLANNMAGLEHMLQRRRARGVPEEGWAV